MNSLPSSRKGQGQLTITSLGIIAITLVVAAVILGLGATILDNIQGTQTDKSTTILSNESWAWPGNNTLQSFVQSRVITSSVVVWCNTSLLTVNQNYTVSTDGVKIINLTASAGTGTIEHCVFNMTYPYNYGSDSYNSSSFGLTGVSTMSEFIPTIAIVASAAIVIGILLMFFARRKEE